jgi:hypothetical protein
MENEKASTNKSRTIDEWGSPQMGNRRLGNSVVASDAKAPVAVDDATQLAYVGMRRQEKQGITIGIMVRAVNRFNYPDNR